MTLTDTGPLVALIDTGDDYNTSCEEQLRALSLPLVAPWPWFTEARHLLNRAGGAGAQDGLWELVTGGFLAIHAPSASEQARMRELLVKYRDTPMDLADAAVVAAAEVLNALRVFSIDSDFMFIALLMGLLWKLFPALPPHANHAGKRQRMAFFCCLGLFCRVGMICAVDNFAVSRSTSRRRQSRLTQHAEGHTSMKLSLSSRSPLALLSLSSRSPLALLSLSSRSPLALLSLSSR